MGVELMIAVVQVPAVPGFAALAAEVSAGVDGTPRGASATRPPGH